MNNPIYTSTNDFSSVETGRKISLKERLAAAKSCVVGGVTTGAKVVVAPAAVAVAVVANKVDDIQAVRASKQEFKELTLIPNGKKIIAERELFKQMVKDNKAALKSQKEDK